MTSNSRNMKILCDLGPCSPMINEAQRTPAEVLAWIERQACLVTNEVTGNNLTASIWGYRLHKAQLLSCDIRDEHRNGYSLTFNTGHDHDFSEFDPTVPDMVEAIHIANLLALRLGCVIELGPSSRSEV